MLFQKPVIAGCIVALGLASVLAPGGHLSIIGDTNGDHAIDILDIQAVVAQVMGDAPSAAGDVNADGRVDILDLQRVVAQATQADKPAKSPDGTPRPEATLPSSAPVFLCLTPHGQVVFGLVSDGSDVSRQWEEASVSSRLSTQIERYLFTLTPHAPPSLEAAFLA